MRVTGGNMPVLRVEMWEGSDNEIKKRLVKDLTQAMVKNTGCPEESVTIIISDISKDNWAIGGKLSSDPVK